MKTGNNIIETLPDAFDHRAAIPTSAGEVHLGWGRCAGQARFVQKPEDVLRGRQRGEGIDCLRDPHRENPLRVQRLTPRGIIERQIASQRADGRDGTRRDSGARLLHVVDQGLHIAGVTGISHRQMHSKDECDRFELR